MTVAARFQGLSPVAVHKVMRERSIVLADVREPQEYVAGRVHGALLFPLSTFDPDALPSPEGCQVVFHCGSGMRSALAIAQCREREIAHTAHMASGIEAWKAAGLQTIALDPASGGVADRR